MELQVKDKDLQMEVFPLICGILEEMPLLLLIQDNTNLECRFAGSSSKT